MVERVLDLRSFTTLCGDYSVHILGKLEEMSPGERLKVVVVKDAADLLRDSIEAVKAAGIAEPLEEGEEDGAYYVVLAKK